jgi:hypothetical protein
MMGFARSVAFGVILLFLILKGLARHLGSWSRSEWGRFAVRLAWPSLMILGAVVIAFSLDRVRHYFSVEVTYFGVLAMLLLLVDGVFLLVATVSDFAGNEIPRFRLVGLTRVVSLVLLALVAAMWWADRGGPPFERSSTVVTGAFVILFGLSPPSWLPPGRTGPVSRAIAVLFGLLFLCAGLTGEPEAMLHWRRW